MAKRVKSSPEYIPRYAEGEIVVFFNEADVEDSKKFMQGFGAHMGYEFKEMWRWDTNGTIAVYKTDVGKEDETISYLESISFVQRADRIDSRLEARTDGIEDVIDSLRELDDNLEIPDDDYKQKLDTISQKLEKLYGI